MSSKLPARILQPVDPDLLKMMGKAPVLPGEDFDAYNALFERLRSAVAPADDLEEIWVFDFVDLTWEVLRLRRLKTQLFKSCAGAGLARILKNLPDVENPSRLVADWVMKEPQSVKRVDELLAQAGLDRETVWAQTLAVRIDDFDRIDHMIARAEERRSAVLREVEHHRATLARRLQEAAMEIEDAEFEDVTVPGDESRRPSASARDKSDGRNGKASIGTNDQQVKQ